MAAHLESPRIRMFGYLQHKGKKKLISFWRKYYCVLSGRILLFYNSESAYQSLENYHHSLDLGLVYAVQPALGTEYAIQISTHLGPQWLRARDELCYNSWLEALRVACNTSAKEDIISETGSNGDPSNTPPLAKMCRDHSHNRETFERKALSVNFAVDSFSKLAKKGSSSKDDVGTKSSSSKRISLNFFTGHGRKYPSYDGMRTLNAAESSSEAFNEDVNNESDPDETSKPGGITLSLVNRRVKKETKDSRPLSESVSDFLLLNSPTKKEAPASSTAAMSPVIKGKTLQKPRLPKNKKLNKLLLHVEDSDFTRLEMTLGGELFNEQRHVKSMSNLQVGDEKVELSTRATSDSKVDLANATTNAELRKPASTLESAQEKHENEAPLTDNIACLSEAVGTETGEQSYISTHDVIESSKKKRKEKRRKSSLAKLRGFLKFPKANKHKEKENKTVADFTKAIQTVDQDKVSTDNSPNAEEEKNAISAGDRELDEIPCFQSQQVYQQQISEGSNEEALEESVNAEKALNCEVVNSESEKQLTSSHSGLYDIQQLEQQIETSTEFPHALVQSRQRKHSANSSTQQGIQKSRSRRPSTQSNEFDSNNRASHNFDSRKSTIRALDFNFDLSTLDVMTNDSLPLPAKTRCREPSPGNYDKPRTLCKHCSVPIIELVRADVARDKFTTKNTTISLTELHGIVHEDHEMRPRNRRVVSPLKEHSTSSSSNHSLRTDISHSAQVPDNSEENDTTKGKIASLVKFFAEKQNQPNTTLDCPHEEKNSLSYALTEEVVFEETLYQIEIDDNSDLAFQQILSFQNSAN